MPESQDDNIVFIVGVVGSAISNQRENQGQKDMEDAVAYLETHRLLPSDISLRGPVRACVLSSFSHV